MRFFANSKLPALPCVGKLSGLLWFLLLAVVLWWAYQPSFSGPFYFDSVHHLEEVPRYQVTELSAEQLGDSIRRYPGGPLYRPVSSFTLGLNHYFLGPEPDGFRAVNVAIHFATTLALVFLFNALVRVASAMDKHPFIVENAKWIVLTAATLWALHPIQTNAVTYVIQRMAMLAALFIFLCVGCYLRARLAQGRAKLYWGGACLAALVLGALSKANGNLAFPLCIAAELIFLVNWESKSYRRYFGIAAGAFAALSMAAVFRLGPAMLAQINHMLGTRDFTIWERTLTQARLQLWYLFLLLFPDHRALQFDADVVLSTGVFSPPHTAMALAVIAGALYCAYSVRKRLPLLSFGILWFFLAQILESTVIPLELYFEHRMYAPSVFVYFAISVFLAYLFATLKGRESWLSSAVLATTVVLATIMAVGTHARNEIWGDMTSFAYDNYSKNPEKERNISRYARALVEAGAKAENEEGRDNYFIEALAYSKLAAEKAPDTARVRHNLALAYRRLGEHEKAEEELLPLLEYPPKTLSVAVLITLAHLLEQKREFDRALVYAETAVEKAPHKPFYRGVLASVLANTGRIEEAHTHLRRAVELDPGYADGWFILGVIQLKLGDRKAARSSIERAASLKPDHPKYGAGLKLIVEQVENDSP